jgi:hypothetical protein
MNLMQQRKHAMNWRDGSREYERTMHANEQKEGEKEASLGIPIVSHAKLAS